MALGRKPAPRFSAVLFSRMPSSALLAWPSHADFSEPRSRARRCFSALRWPLITCGEEASTESRFAASNIQPATGAIASIITSTNASAAADSGRPPHPAASLSRLTHLLRQPIMFDVRRASEATCCQPSEKGAFRSTVVHSPAARPVARPATQLKGRSAFTQGTTSARWA